MAAAGVSKGLFRDAVMVFINLKVKAKLREEEVSKGDAIAWPSDTLLADDLQIEYADEVPDAVHHIMLPDLRADL